MPGNYQDPPPWLSWTREEWLERADRAAAYLATDPKWKVGAAKVAYYRRMAEKAGSNG